MAPLRLGAARAVSELPFGASEIVAGVAGAKRLLDAGCGSGRLTIALAEAEIGRASCRERV